MTELRKVPPFGQADPTDNRELLDWRSKYPDPEAKRWILFEAIYVTLLLMALPLAMLVLWLGYPKSWFHLSDQAYPPILKYGLSWLSGALGGTLFDTKWLYHSVARQIWHLDRRLWRFFVPHIAGGLAFVVVALIASGLLRIFDSRAVESGPTIVGVGFLVGYFSDNAIAKLREVADTLFGASRTEEKHRTKGSESNSDSRKEEK
jgi:hypothetical protein